MAKLILQLIRGLTICFLLVAGGALIMQGEIPTAVICFVLALFFNQQDIKAEIEELKDEIKRTVSK